MRVRAQWVPFACAACCAAHAAAQGPPSVPPPPVMIELTIHDRWLLEGQQSRHVWFGSTTTSIRVVDVRREGGITTFLMRPRNETVQLRLDDARRIIDVDADWTEPRPSSIAMPAVALRRFALNDRVRLFDFDAQEFALALRLPTPRAGARWVDTVSIESTRGLTTQRLRGERTSTIIGDTTVNGRRHLIVRDSMRAQYHEAWGDWSRTLDTLEVRSRSVTGVIRGRTLVDAGDTIMLAVRDDTTTFTGTDEIRYADGRTFAAPVSYTRHRSYRTYGPGAYAVRQEELRRAGEATAFSIVEVPRNEFEERLARGERPLLDSLTLVYRTSSDPDVRRRVRSLQLPAELRQRLDSLHVIEGDTAVLVAQLNSAWPGAFDPPQDQLELLFAIQRDPQLAWRHGIDQDPLYENLRDALVRNPPALQPDTARWPCAPRACQALAAQRTATGDPRARDLGLIAAFVLEPRRWADTLMLPVNSNSAMLESTRQLIAGAGATWAAAAKAPIPAPNADWRAWVYWMTGQDSSYRPPATTAARPRDVVRFEDTHRRALTLHELLTGRDVTAELRLAFESAQSDSARLVFGSMLLALGEWQPTQEQLVSDLRSGSAARVALARRGVGAIMRDAQLATPDVAAYVIRRMLEHVIEKRNTFAALPGEIARPPAGPPRTDTIYMIADSVPASVRAGLPANVQLITQEEWDARSTRHAATLMRVGEVRQNGPFIRANYRAFNYYSRTPEQAPQASAQGESWTLLRIGDELFLVDGVMWIT